MCPASRRRLPERSTLVGSYLTHVYDSGYPYLPGAAIGAAIGALAGDARWAVVVGDVTVCLGLLLLAWRLRPR